MPIYSNIAPSNQVQSRDELSQMPFHRFAAFNIARTGDRLSNSFRNLHEAWTALPAQVEWLRARQGRL